MAVELNGSIYIIGGWDGQGKSIKKTVVNITIDLAYSILEFFI